MRRSPPRVEDSREARAIWPDEPRPESADVGEQLHDIPEAGQTKHRAGEGPASVEMFKNAAQGTDAVDVAAIGRDVAHALDGAGRQDFG